MVTAATYFCLGLNINSIIITKTFTESRLVGWYFITELVPDENTQLIHL